MYQEYNAAFAKYWKAKTGDDVVISQSHGGSGKQAQSVINGLEADVVTLALAYDIDAISAKGETVARRLAKTPAGQQHALHLDHRVSGAQGKSEAHQGLGRRGETGCHRRRAESENLRRRALGVSGRLRLRAGNHTATTTRRRRTSSRKLYKNVPVLDSGARGSTITFAQRGIGDVLLAWENEAHLALKEFGADKFEIVTPPLSILAEPPVAVVDKTAKRHGTTEVAKAYLEYLYSDEGQEIAAKNFYRPRNQAIAAKYAANFTQLKLVTVDQEFGGWTKAQATHFADGGVFDQIYQP